VLSAVYKVVELIGTSPESWENAGAGGEDEMYETGGND
jgi:flavin-binding protein dodecin